MTRVTKAVFAAGLDVARVEIAKDGAIVVVPGKPEELASLATAVAERDEIA